MLYIKGTSFIENYIQQYDTSSQIPVHFVGSIAYHLQDEIRVLLAEKGINVGKIIRKPIDGLIQYHANEN